MAAGVSGVIGLRAFEYEHYAYWRAWARRRFVWGFAFMVAVNAVAGAATVGAAVLLDWTPRHGAWALNGFVYALVAQGVLRVELKSHDLRVIDEGRSLLAFAQAFVGDFLDRGGSLAVQARLAQLSDQSLFDQCKYLHGKYVVGDTAILPRVRATRLKLLNDAAGLLTAGNQDGRGTLEGYCLDTVAKRRLDPAMTWMPALRE
jgi:hypothetical protein